MNRGMPAFGVRARRSSSLSPNHRVSSFRGLPRKAAAPNAEPSRLRLAKPPPSKSGSLARTCGDGKGARLASHRRWSAVFIPSAAANQDWPRCSLAAMRSAAGG